MCRNSSPFSLLFCVLTVLFFSIQAVAGYTEPVSGTLVAPGRIEEASGSRSRGSQSPPISAFSSRLIIYGRTGQDSIVIGLVAALTPEGVAIRRAAHLALTDANNAGGYQGRPFSIIARSDEGLWGSGTQNMSRLVFEDEARAIVGSLDGMSAHLVEQIVTKARVPYVTPWVSDPTLAQANIPWFFRCVPDDEEQSRALIAEIKTTRNFRRVATVADGTYDGRMAQQTFVKQARASGLFVVTEQVLEAGNDHQVIESLRHSKADVFLLFGRPTTMAAFLLEMRARKLEPPVFGSLYLSESPFVQAARGEFPTAVVKPGSWDSPAADTFRNRYRRLYGQPPTEAALYTYDAVMVVVEAIRTGGLDKWKIRDALARTRFDNGLTGPIRFDENGNRIGAAIIEEINQSHRPGTE